MTFWTKGRTARENRRRKVMPHALPVFSVDTEDEALSLQVANCVLIPVGPLAGRYVWTGFVPGDEGQLRAITEKLRAQYERMKARRSVWAASS